jgi:hypothetical protein
VRIRKKREMERVFYRVIGDRKGKTDIDISGCLKLSEREANRFKHRVEKMGYVNVRVVRRV